MIHKEKINKIHMTSTLDLGNFCDEMLIFSFTFYLLLYLISTTLFIKLQSGLLDLKSTTQIEVDRKPAKKESNKKVNE